MNDGESSSQLIEPTPAGRGGRLPDPRNQLFLVESVLIDVGPPQVLIFASAGRYGLQRSALKERHLHIAGEYVVTHEPTFALDAIEGRVPPHRAHCAWSAHDEVVESAPDFAFPARHGRDVGLHRGVAVGLRDLGIAARKENRLGAGLCWLTGSLVCHCVQSNMRFVRLNLLEI